MSPQSRYTTVRKIADGGTAEIFLAKQTGVSGFEKLVVLKRVFSTFYADPQFRHMLVDEAHVAMSLYHSNIVQVLDLAEADGRHFLALELVDGWTLDEVLKRAKTANFAFPPALALYVTAEVCRALAYAHGKSRDGQPLGIVHRDVSPHNVLLSEHGEVKLTDFGMAKARIKHERSVGNLIKGKIAFMSPEQARGDALDARSDLFSLGVVLYLMITRRPPFDAPSDYETLMQVRAGEFVPPEAARPRLNPEVHRVIRKAMANASADRYQSAADMLADVEQVMRVGFRAVGQTELAQWLSDLGAKDGVPPLTGVQPSPASDSLVIGSEPVTSTPDIGAPPAPVETQPAPAMRVASDSDRSVELDLDGADGALMATPPPEPAPPPPSLFAPKLPLAPPAVGDSAEPDTSPRPRPFWQAASFGKRTIWIAGAVVLLLAIAAGTLNIERSYEHVRSSSSSYDRRAAATPAADSASAARVASAAASRAGTPAVTSPSTAAPTHRPSKEVAREQSDDGDLDPDHKESRDAPEKRVAKKSQTAVAIESEPDGSQVRTGRRMFGVTPISLRLRPGSYHLTFTKPGYLPTTKTVRVASSRRSIHVSLRRARPRKPARAAESVQAESEDGGWHFSR